jgi:hypothetical protein
VGGSRFHLTTSAERTNAVDRACTFLAAGPASYLDRSATLEFEVASIFISHSSKDKPLARRIATDLQSAGITVWLDEWEILVGDSITQRVADGISSSDFLAVLLSINSVESGWVEKEWQAKVRYEATRRKVAILPLLADDCQIPLLLQDKKHADFRGDYASALAQVVAAVSGHIADRNVASVESELREEQSLSSDAISGTSTTFQLMKLLSILLGVGMVCSLIGLVFLLFVYWDEPLFYFAKGAYTVGALATGFIGLMIFGYMMEALKGRNKASNRSGDQRGKCMDGQSSPPRERKR